MPEPSAELSLMAANEQGSLTLSCRTDPLRLALRRPRVANRFGGQDQAPPDCGSVTPERVERRVLVVPVFQPGKGRLVDPTSPGHLGQGESCRLAGPLDLVHERAQLMKFAASPLAINSSGEGCQFRNMSRMAWWRARSSAVHWTSRPTLSPLFLLSLIVSSSAFWDRAPGLRRP